MFATIPLVTGIFSLAAFVAAILLLAYRARLKQQAELLKSTDYQLRTGAKRGRIREDIREPLQSYHLRVLGRDAEARDAAARLLQIDPSFTISHWIARGGQSNSKLLIEGFRKAGLPE